MVDLRERVEEERGLIKNIELAIPGFRGYRKREDLRIADSLLRIQLADLMKEGILGNLTRTRELLSRSLELSLMNDLGGAIQLITGAEARIRHAEEGYSGISPSYQINEKQLNTLYEYDLLMIQLIQDISLEAAQVLDNSREGSYPAVRKGIAEISDKVRNLSNIFSKRHVTMANLGAC